MTPSPKSPAVAALLQHIFSRTMHITGDRCVHCGESVREAMRTWTELEQREYRISGLCAACWSAVFGMVEDEAGNAIAP